MSRIISLKIQDLGKYGLSSPRAVITVKRSRTANRNLDDRKEIIRKRNIKLGNADTVYLMKNIPESYISYTLIDMTDIDTDRALNPTIFTILILQKDKDDFEVIYDPDLKYYKTTALFISS